MKILVSAGIVLLIGLGVILLVGVVVFIAVLPIAHEELCHYEKGAKRD